MSFFDTLLGNDAAKASKEAAADTYAKQQQATQGLQSYGATLPSAYNTLAQGYSPYTQAGGDALTRLRAGLGLGGDTGAFTQGYQSLPGYQSGLNTGLTSAERALKAGGMDQSGAALKALYRYGSDYENQRAGDYLNRLGGLASSGLSATGQQVGTQTQGLGAQTGVNTNAFGGQMQSAGTIGQGQVAAAQAQQQGAANTAKLAAAVAGTALGGFGGLGLGALGSLGGGILSGVMGGGAGGPAAQQTYWGGGGYGPSQSNSLFSQA